MQYQHGGDVYGYAAQFGRAPLDFSANINPRGMPDAVRDALHRAVDDCVRYPDPFCRALTGALSARYGQPSDRFLCGNGAADLFFRLAAVLRPRRVLLLAPTFGEYEAALHAAGSEPVFHNLLETDGFAVTPRILDDLTEDLDSVWLCNPNNPTGRTIDPELLEQIALRCREIGARLVLDECFADFLTDEADHSMRMALDRFPDLVIVRAFTKMYAVPGVRLGWLMTADTALVDRLHAAGQPWAVSVPAQACGVAALSCAGWEAESAAQIARDRTALAAGLRESGLAVIPSEVNYLLFHSPDAGLREALLPRGILVRDCANYRGLAPGWFRVAVRTPEENARLIENIQEVLHGQGHHGTGNRV